MQGVGSFIVSKKPLNKIRDNKRMAEEEEKRGLNRVIEITGAELGWLVNLKKINNSIREEEIISAKNKMAKLNKYIASARLRLDAIRLIKTD